MISGSIANSIARKSNDPSQKTHPHWTDVSMTGSTRWAVVTVLELRAYGSSEGPLRCFGFVSRAWGQVNSRYHVPKAPTPNQLVGVEPQGAGGFPGGRYHSCLVSLESLTASFGFRVLERSSADCIAE